MENTKHEKTIKTIEHFANIAINLLDNGILQSRKQSLALTQKKHQAVSLIKGWFDVFYKVIKTLIKEL